MLTVAYLANLFPSAVEPYVIEEIAELRRRGVRVIAGSARRAEDQLLESRDKPEIVLQPLRMIILTRALLLCMRRWRAIAPLLARILFRGREEPFQRLKALAHTWMGGCYAVLLQSRGVDHIHVHHGYFGSWIAMVAARLLDVEFSVTLHGSDLLLHGTYLDVKLESCKFCVTVSGYNRSFILRHYPAVEAEKAVVARLGVDVSDCAAPRMQMKTNNDAFTLLAVGRLHRVKDHAFLVRACAQLRDRNVYFECSIAGEGPERRNLEKLIRSCGLEKQVTLLGHVARADMSALYDRADVVVLTSRSEGIPLVLMEAMARGKIVLAPAITGISELVIAGKTGFLYEPGSAPELVARLEFIRSSMIQSAMRPPDDPEHRSRLSSEVRQLDWIRHAARVQVQLNFNRSRNLELFGDMFLERVTPQTESIPHEDFVLQQI
jgi:colanic acid/amylovoran biosynthesis glycosyltransferase